MALVSNNIYGVRLGIVGVGIGLYQIAWSNIQVVNIPVDIEYRVLGDPTWIIAFTGLSIPPSGIVNDSPKIVLASAVAGTTYEVRAYEYESTSAFIQEITVPLLLFGNNYLVEDQIYNICGVPTTFLYSTGKFATGVTMYDDILLTTPISESLISEPSGGDIYAVTAGVIGATTGYGCFYWSAGLYVLGASTSLCTGQPVVELYTDGPVDDTLEGMILYEDKELTTPVAGSDYVLEVETEIIFNLNSGTGEVETPADTCDDFYNVLIQNTNSKRVITGVFGIEGFGLISTLTTGEEQIGAHIAFEGEILLNLSGGGNCDNCGVDSAELFINDVSTETIPVQDGSYTFASVSYSGDDVIKIVLNQTLAVPAP